MVVHQWLRLMTSKKLCVSTEVVVIMCTLSPSNEAQMVSKFQPDMYSLEISPRLFNKCVVINTTTIVLLHMPTQTTTGCRGFFAPNFYIVHSGKNLDIYEDGSIGVWFPCHWMNELISWRLSLCLANNTITVISGAECLDF